MARGFIAWLPIGPFSTRPRLVGAILAGFAAGAFFVVVPLPLRSSTKAILTWDVACLWFIVASLIGMSGRNDRDIEARAKEQDDGRSMILGLVLLASIAELAASGLELSLAKNDHGVAKSLRVALAFGTVAASWFLSQLIFALHYAHEYYSRGDAGQPLNGGLKFPDDFQPDYWDFMHFSIIIGVAAQTADVSFSSKRLRRVGTVHSVLAFTCNTVVLALSINLWAGIF